MSTNEELSAACSRDHVSSSELVSLTTPFLRFDFGRYSSGFVLNSSHKLHVASSRKTTRFCERFHRQMYEYSKTLHFHARSVERRSLDAELLFSRPEWGILI